jgi:putative RNA 2'-phosphotransferase
MKLKMCTTHGPFRGEKCPVCEQEGKFLLNDWETDAVSRILTGVLRHFPDKFNLRLDEHGWSKIDDIVDAIKKRHPRFVWLKPMHIEYFIMTDSKGRFQLDMNEKKVRAVYGHSIDVDLTDLPTDKIPDKLYYATTSDEEEFILEIGLKPGERRWIHLSKSYDEAYIAGKHRTDGPVILEINAKDALENHIVFYRAAKTIYITKDVPVQFIKHARKRKVEVPEEEMRLIEEEKRRKEKKEREKLLKKEKFKEED